ncbi:BBP7 family outer membrane beta-barrel protein [Adhaeretor mobilis]|uniref:Alginate export domain-containing protein n=1 Tax=Adhaeretor mobilis TaxID=1930276 RepID=A0A517MRS3_9BACT|nr:BBP7 family outer membrane beta-barrel protein [Adhaeretor mobilis]QDS97581.1 hypothetical protein HG15A2_08440 [Adhaeretor mobilis]
MKNNIAFAIITTFSLAACQALAQSGEEMPLEALPPGLELSDSEVPFDGQLDSGPLTPDVIPAPTNELSPFSTSGSSTEDDAIAPFVPGANMREYGCEPALLESTGTWLRRGFWYAQADMVILNRTWERKGLLLATDATLLQGAPGLNGIRAGNDLNIDGNKPGADGTFRLTLGRFLFRDEANRDHTTEFSWWGDGHWNQEARVAAGQNATAGLQVSNFIDRLNTSFDGASDMRFVYESHMDSFEWNYHVKQRMSRDRMEMQPSGQWVRKAHNSVTYSYLAGLRFINHREALDWTANDIPAGGGLTEDGKYFVTTDNNLLGTQVGGTAAIERDRWSLEVLGKIGGYWNAMDTNSLFNVGAVASNQANGEEDTLSTVGEARLIGRWHLRPNLSIRAGIELLWIDSIALAPQQLNFIQSANLPIAESGDSVYMGTSFGLESYW